MTLVQVHLPLSVRVSGGHLTVLEASPSVELGIVVDRYEKDALDPLEAAVSLGLGSFSPALRRSW